MVTSYIKKINDFMVFLNNPNLRYVDIKLNNKNLNRILSANLDNLTLIDKIVKKFPNVTMINTNDTSIKKEKIFTDRYSNVISFLTENPNNYVDINENRVDIETAISVMMALSTFFTVSIDVIFKINNKFVINFRPSIHIVDGIEVGESNKIINVNEKPLFDSVNTNMYLLYDFDLPLLKKYLDTNIENKYLYAFIELSNDNYPLEFNSWNRLFVSDSELDISGSEHMGTVKIEYPSYMKTISDVIYDSIYFIPDKENQKYVFATETQFINKISNNIINENLSNIDLFNFETKMLNYLKMLKDTICEINDKLPNDSKIDTSSIEDYNLLELNIDEFINNDTLNNVLFNGNIQNTVKTIFEQSDDYNRIYG